MRTSSGSHLKTCKTLLTERASCNKRQTSNYINQAVSRKSRLGFLMDQWVPKNTWKIKRKLRMGSYSTTEIQPNRLLKTWPGCSLRRWPWKVWRHSTAIIIDSFRMRKRGKLKIGSVSIAKTSRHRTLRSCWPRGKSFSNGGPDWSKKKLGNKEARICQHQGHHALRVRF